MVQALRNSINRLASNSEKHARRSTLSGPNADAPIVFSSDHPARIRSLMKQRITWRVAGSFPWDWRNCAIVFLIIAFSSTTSILLFLTSLMLAAGK